MKGIHWQMQLRHQKDWEESAGSEFKIFLFFFFQFQTSTRKHCSNHSLTREGVIQAFLFVCQYTRNLAWLPLPQPWEDVDIGLCQAAMVSPWGHSQVLAQNKNVSLSVFAELV